MEKNSKINQILMRPTHSRQEISNQDKNKLKELEGNNPELLMPQKNNELFNFNENNNNNNNSEKLNEEEKLGTDITELIKEFPKEDNEKVLENNNLTEENIKYVDQEGYEFEYVKEGEYDDNDSVYSDEDGNLIRYLDKGYKTKSKKKFKKKNNKINYKYFIIYSLIILLIIVLIKNYRIKI